MQTRVLEAPPRNQTILKVFAFSQVRNSLFFWFVLSETAPRRHSATVLELGGLQLHPNTRVCVFIPSQAKLTGTASSPRPLSSITHRSALTCLLRKLEQHGEARTESLADSGGSRLEKQLLDLPHTSVGARFQPCPAGGGRPRSPLFLSFLTSARTEEECGTRPLKSSTCSLLLT